LTDHSSRDRLLEVTNGLATTHRAQSTPHTERALAVAVVGGHGSLTDIGANTTDVTGRVLGCVVDIFIDEPYGTVGHQYVYSAGVAAAGGDPNVSIKV